MKKVIYSVLAGMLISVAACSDSPEVTKQEKWTKELTISAPCKAASRGAQQLDVKLFQAQCAMDSQFNSLISPLNVTTFLSMFANTIADESELKSLIYEYLGCPDATVVNELMSEYMQQLGQLDSESKVTFLNHVWYSRKYTIAPTFAEILAQYYDGTCESADFSDSGALQTTINRWVYINSDGLLDVHINDMESEYIAMQLMKFESTWANVFDADKTAEAAFYPAEDNRPVIVSMMNGKMMAGYYGSDNYNVFRLKFGGGVYVADFILPQTGVSIDDVIAEADFGAWTDADMDSRSFEIYMPKLKLQTSRPVYVSKLLNEIDPRFNTYTLTPTALFNEQVASPVEFKQNIAIDLTETGVKVVSETHSGMHSGFPPSVLRFNRPFAMMIRLRETGAILAAAKIVNPTAAF